MASSNENNQRKSPWDEENIDKSKPTSSQTNFEDLWRRGQFSFNDAYSKFKGHNNPKNNDTSSIKLLSIIAAAITAIWLFSGFYVVDEGEQALVVRFGKYERTALTGLNYHIPNPIEHIIIEKVDTLRKEEIGFRTVPGNNSTNNSSTISQESLMLTGDENIVDINFIVQWRISNLKDYIFNIYNPRETVRSVSESAMREIIGVTPIDKAIQDGRFEVEQETKNLVQNILNSYNSGIEITTIKLLRADPPAEVIDAFRDVQTARTEKEKEINRASAFHNEVIPQARGDAAKIILEGEAYKSSVVQKAEGEARRFELIYNQYKNAKEVTKKRLYLESMEAILQGMDKVIVDNKNGVVPYLPLNQMDKR